MFLRETGDFLWQHYLCEKDIFGEKLPRHEMLLQWNKVVRHMSNLRKAYDHYNRFALTIEMWLEETFYYIFIEHPDRYIK